MNNELTPDEIAAIDFALEANAYGQHSPDVRDMLAHIRAQDDKLRRVVWPGDAPMTVEVFYMEGESPFICGFSGHTGLLEELESEIEILHTECPEIFSKGEGEYLFRASYNDAQVDYLGRTEIPAHFDLDEIGFKHHDKEQPERYAVLSGDQQ